MKKLFITLTVMALALFAANAEEKTKTYDFGDIRSINVGYMYEVFVTEGNSDEVKVVYDSKFEDYIQVKYTSEKRKVSISMKDNLPKVLTTGQLPRIKVYLEMNDIENLQLSGAVTVNFEGEYKAGEAKIEISGASKIKNLNIKGKSLDFTCSGASKADIEGNFSGDVDIDLSGASKVEYTGNCKEINVEASGASYADMEGASEDAEFECSGASNIQAKKFITKNATVYLSGASKADVHATSNLAYSASRACKITYYGDAVLKNLSPDTNVRKGNL